MKDNNKDTNVKNSTSRFAGFSGEAVQRFRNFFRHDDKELSQNFYEWRDRNNITLRKNAGRLKLPLHSLNVISSIQFNDPIRLAASLIQVTANSILAEGGKPSKWVEKLRDKEFIKKLSEDKNLQKILQEKHIKSFAEKIKNDPVGAYGAVSIISAILITASGFDSDRFWQIIRGGTFAAAAYISAKAKKYEGDITPDMGTAEKIKKSPMRISAAFGLTASVALVIDGIEKNDPAVLASGVAGIAANIMALMYKARNQGVDADTPGRAVG